MEKGDLLKSKINTQKAMEVISKLTYNVDFYNVLNKGQKDEDEKLTRIMDGDVKNSLNLTAKWRDFNYKVYNALSNDFMRPVTHLGNTNNCN